MDFDRERELEDAGIDAFEFSMMDEAERRAVLRDNLLDPDDYDMIDLDPEFQAWENLQSAGLSLSELSYMDDCEKKAALEDAGLDADDYGVDPGYYHYSYVSRSKPAAKKPAPKPAKTAPVKPPVQAKTEPSVRKAEPVPVKPKPAEKIFPNRLYFYCGVKFPFSDHVFWYLTGDLDLEVGDRVEVPLGATDDPVTGEVVSVRTGTESDLPFSPKDAKHVSRIVKTKNGGIYTSTGRVAHSVGDLNPKPKKAPEPEEEAKHVPPPAGKRRPPTGFILFTAAACILIVIAGIQTDRQYPGSRAPAATPRPAATAAPRPTPSPSPTPRRVYTVGSSSSKSDPDRPRIGETISRKEETYFLGGGGKNGGVSTSKFRLNRGTKTYVVYLDNDNVVKKVEDYQPRLSSGSNKSSEKEKTSGGKLPASDYVHPDDFYYDYYDDFDDYEDAEEYWEEYG